MLLKNSKVSVRRIDLHYYVDMRHKSTRKGGGFSFLLLVDELPWYVISHGHFLRRSITQTGMAAFSDNIVSASKRAWIVYCILYHRLHLPHFSRGEVDAA